MRLQNYINEATRKKPTFVRFGGLSKVDQTKYGISQNFHKAPANKGVFAFIWPYIESFLFAWKMKTLTPPPEAKNWSTEQWKEYNKLERKQFNKFYKDNMKKFTYEGWIWVHFIDISPKYIRRREGTWVEIHTSNFDEVLKKAKHKDMKSMAGDEYMGNLDIRDPYKKGLGGFMSRDHLEVFIEDKI